jgi:hypothetical protein
MTFSSSNYLVSCGVMAVCRNLSKQIKIRRLRNMCRSATKEQKITISCVRLPIRLTLGIYNYLNTALANNDIKLQTMVWHECYTGEAIWLSPVEFIFYPGKEAFPNKMEFSFRLSGQNEEERRVHHGSEAIEIHSAEHCDAALRSDGVGCGACICRCRDGHHGTGLGNGYAGAYGT